MKKGNVQMNKEHVLKYIQEVIKSGEINKKTEYDQNIVHLAMKYGEEELALEILRRGDFDLSVMDFGEDNGYNLLFLASRYACEEVVDFLLESTLFRPYINEGISPLEGVIPELFCLDVPIESEEEYEKRTRTFDKILASKQCTNMKSFYGHDEAGILSSLIAGVKTDRRLEDWACKLIASPKMVKINEIFEKNGNYSNLLLKAISVRSRSIAEAILRRPDFQNINEFQPLYIGDYQNHALVRAFCSSQFEVVDDLLDDDRLSLMCIPELVREMMLCFDCKDDRLLEMIKKIKLPQREKGAYDAMMGKNDFFHFPMTISYLLESDKVLLSERFFASFMIEAMRGRSNDLGDEYLSRLFFKREVQINENKYDEVLEDELLTHYWIFYSCKSNKFCDNNIIRLSKKEELEKCQEQLDLIRIEIPLWTYFAGELYVLRERFFCVKEFLEIGSYKKNILSLGKKARTLVLKKEGKNN